MDFRACQALNSPALAETPRTTARHPRLGRPRCAVRTRPRGTAESRAACHDPLADAGIRPRVSRVSFPGHASLEISSPGTLSNVLPTTLPRSSTAGRSWAGSTNASRSAPCGSPPSPPACSRRGCPSPPGRRRHHLVAARRSGTRCRRARRRRCSPRPAGLDEDVHRPLGVAAGGLEADAGDDLHRPGDLEVQESQRAGDVEPVDLGASRTAAGYCSSSGRRRSTRAPCAACTPSSSIGNLCLSRRGRCG